ncbi:uncharacterized protein B0H18DRAFT_973302, partial [Fomitopsis serialis]|uniref:uncharacterized protein n=1 Tax=Fomitopsis serialis TaxID=139415 RepID=UPI00200860C0
MRPSLQAARPFVNWLKTPGTKGAPSVPAKGRPATKPVTALATVRNEGALRPHLDIPVNPNHGLYGFFRRNEVDGVAKYETLDVFDSTQAMSGTSVF